MIRSMTAFARVSEPTPYGTWTVEIRSLNNRFLELSLRVPSSLNLLENAVREEIQSQISRGKVAVNIFQDSENGGAPEVSINDKAVKFYIRHLRKLGKQYKLRDDLSVGDLLRIPSLFTAEQDQKKPAKLWPVLKKLLAKASRQLIERKGEEGRKLAGDILSRLERIEQSVQKVEKMAEGTAGRLFTKLKERVEAILQDKGLEEERVSREVAFLAEKADVTEEVVRMHSHIGLFRTRLKSGKEVGRELDFLCQELNREINTMGSKSQLFEISTEVVFMKGELEKIREQIQNIE